MTDFRETWDMSTIEGSQCFASAILSRLVGYDTKTVVNEVWLAAYLRANCRPVLTTAPQAEKDDELPPRVGHIFRLAEIIREVDGNHDKGAEALAEAILSHAGSRWGRPVAPSIDTTSVEAPTDEDLYNLADEYSGESVASMRAALARWGRPAQPAPLSPAAQDVIDAAAGGPVADRRAFPLLCHGIATAFRVAAEQPYQVPAHVIGESYWPFQYGVDAERDRLRCIADELDPTTTITDAAKW